MNKLGKIFLGTVGAGTAWIVGLGLLANVQNGDIKLNTPTTQTVFTESNTTTYPTPDRNSAEYKEVLNMVCESLVSGGDLDCGDFDTHDDAQ
jgi:hypothetical protein